MKLRLILLSFTLAATVTANNASALRVGCYPDEPEELGDDYVPGAPFRRSIGTGFSLEGSIVDTDCQGIPRARVEIWMRGPKGAYDDEHRATVVTDKNGSFRITTDIPPVIDGKTTLIRMKISAAGFRTTVKSYVPPANKQSGTTVIPLGRPERRPSGGDSGLGGELPDGTTF